MEREDSIKLLGMNLDSEYNFVEYMYIKNVKCLETISYQTDRMTMFISCY